MGKPWFNPKRYGYGVGLPCSWEGWLVLAAFLAVVVGGAKVIEDKGQYAILAFLSVVLLIAITAAKTKGGWRWRWGRE